MTTHHLADKPWETVRKPPDWATRMPGLDDLERDPQLGPVSLLQSCADVAVASLLSRHPIARDPSDELFECTRCSSAFIARLVVIRSKELSNLLAAYRIAIRHDSDDSEDF